MKQSLEMPTILIVDDSPSDRKLAIMAFQQAEIHNPIRELVDGDDLMNYLLRKGPYEALSEQQPVVILLDLNMPRMNGLEALAQIKSNPALQSIPVIMLTTSKSDEDIVRSYKLGVNSFVTKPVHFDDFLAAIRKLGEYWLELVALPDRFKH